MLTEKEGKGTPGVFRVLYDVEHDRMLFVQKKKKLH